MYNKDFKFQGCNNPFQNHATGADFRRHCANAIADKMNRRFNGFMNRSFHGQNRAVNILETDEAFILHLYAAGLKKEQFSIEYKNDALTISYRADKPENSQKFIYEEYKTESFERAFKITDKVLIDQISANYINGVLEVTLPKNPETNKPGQIIDIS